MYQIQNVLPINSKTGVHIHTGTLKPQISGRESTVKKVDL